MLLLKSKIVIVTYFGKWILTNWQINVKMRIKGDEESLRDIWHVSWIATYVTQIAGLIWSEHFWLFLYDVKIRITRKLQQTQSGVYILCYLTVIGSCLSANLVRFSYTSKYSILLPAAGKTASHWLMPAVRWHCCTRWFGI